MFDSMAFLRANAKSATTIRTEDGVSVRLEGLPKKYTATELAKLAEKQEKNVRVSLPRQEVGACKAKSSATFESKAKAAEFIKGICGSAPEASDSQTPGAAA